MKLRGEIEVWSEEAAMAEKEKKRVDSVVTLSQTRSVSPSCGVFKRTLIFYYKICEVVKSST